MNKLLLPLLMINACFASSMTILGVQQNSFGFEGVFATLELEIADGSGRIFFNTMPLSQTDTQASARLAVDVACQTLEMNCKDKDFFFTINANSQVIEGPSAGAAMAVIAMAELMNKQLSKSVAITGTISPDKSIGVVGGIVEKAKTSQSHGIKTILIPVGTLHLFENESLNISVVEVSTITEAFTHFTGLVFDEPLTEIDKSFFNYFMRIMSQDLILYSMPKFESLLNQNLSMLDDSDALAIELLINSTNEDINTMNQLFESENYYSASSYSVGIAINSLYIEYLIDYLLDDFDFEEKFRQANDSINSFESNFYEELIIDNANDFEAISISIERLFEAKELLNSAIDYKNNDDSYSSIYNLAFLLVRLKTSESWLGLKDLIKGDLDYEFNQNDFSELAYIRIENARTLLNYAKSIQESGYTVLAEELISNSLSAYNDGDIIYSLFESLKSISNSNLALSLSGITDKNINQRISVLRDLAAKNINSASAKGIMPILAHS
ncbi:MAG: hypothetical protein PHS81_04705, partial [Candidatus Nanoarchaeia archaeon]|nr:hypothetical protein [Candidatus Nanoarchaeia archaeon]